MRKETGFHIRNITALLIFASFLYAGIAAGKFWLIGVSVPIVAGWFFVWYLAVKIVEKSKRKKSQQTALPLSRVATPAREEKKWYKLIIWSVVVALAFLIFTMIGVEAKSSILIVVVGGLAATYFLAVSFWMEKNPGRFEALLSKFGIVLQDGQLTKKQLKAMKDLRCLAALFAVFSAYLALAPCWRTFGYLLVLAMMALALTLISYWKEWDSNVWRHIHRVTLIVCLGALVIFAASVFLNESDAGKWVWRKAAGLWEEKPKPATEAQPVKAVVEVQPAKPLSRAAKPIATTASSPRVIYAPPSVSQPPAMEDEEGDGSISERDRLLDLAEKALDDDVSMKDKKADELSQSAKINSVINRRDGSGKLKPLSGRSGVRVIQIPRWVE